MISTLIRNEMAIQMSIHIIQTFVRLRKQEYIYSGLINRIEKLETFKVETNRTLKKLILQQSNTSKKPASSSMTKSSMLTYLALK